MRLPFSSVFKRVGAALRELPPAERELELVVAVVVATATGAVGVAGDGLAFTVPLDRALSVLELVIELNREVGSFLVIVTSKRPGIV